MQPLQTKTRNHRPDIQGLRAVAVLMVVAFHAGLPVPGGFVGVDVFFVISGFVITGMLGREWLATGRIHFGQFYLRRFKRLTPALALMVAATIVLSAAILSPLGVQQTAAKTGIGAMLLVANVVIAKTTGGYFDADALTNPLLHTWSLSVEEQFYLGFPALIALGWCVARRRTVFRLTPHVIVAAIALISFSLACWGTTLISVMGLPSSLLTGTYARSIQELLGFYSPITRSWEFAAGVLLALTAHRLPLQSRRFGYTLSLVGASMLLTSLWVVSGTKPFPSPLALVPVVGTLLLLAGGMAPANFLTCRLTGRPMVKIGDWSYSIYLWHWPFIVFAGMLWPHNRSALLLGAAASLGPAVASYRWLELPIRNIRSLRGFRAVIIAVVVVPLFLSASVNFVANHGYWSNGVRAMQSAVLQPHSVLGRCAAGNLSTSDPDKSCIFNASAVGKPIFLIGDSTAWHFSEAAIGAGKLLGRPLTIVNIGQACPFKNVHLNYASSPRPDYPHTAKACREGYESAMRWLSKQPPGTVVISELNSFYQYDQYKQTAFGLHSDVLTTNAAERIRILDEGLISTVQTLEKTGHSVLLVQAAPDFEYPEPFSPLRCSLFDLRADACMARLPRTVADAIQQVQRSSLQKIAAETGANLWDPRDFFCSWDECSTQGHGIDLYRDAFHISADASHMLAPSLAAAIQLSG